MADKPSTRTEAWALFDRIVALAAPEGIHSNPWLKDHQGQLHYLPDYPTLSKLLGVPLALRAGTQSGVPALALDVWLSYELRRAGFDKDQAWPRPIHPRILPAPVVAMLKALPKNLREALSERINGKGIKDVTSSSASILGKNYLKQVDVIITDWATGPELLISTKRMDSSYGKNAPNRIEESYGDAKNLRLRHPLAALGFAFGLRSDILKKEPQVAEWLFDLLAKLGQEDDAYHATCLVMMDYADDQVIPDTGEEYHPEGVPELGAEMNDEEDRPAETSTANIDRKISELPHVRVLTEQIPDILDPGRFLATMVSRVLSTTPVNMHRSARIRRTDAPLG